MFAITTAYMDNNTLRSMTERLFEAVPQKIRANVPLILADLDGVGVLKTRRFKHPDWTREGCSVSVIPNFASIEVLVATYRNMVEQNFHLVAGIEEYWRVDD